VDPENPVLTSVGGPELLLQKAGHASLVETQTGDWYLPHLCSRPVGEHRRCILGRETAIQKVIWNEDGWLRMAHGGRHPADTVEAPGLPAHPFDPEPERDDFESESLSVHWNSLRLPADESWMSLSERPGWLRLYGRESVQSLHYQSVMLRRLQAFKVEVTTCVDFGPENFKQLAGLLVWYNTQTHYYLHITEEDGKKVLALRASDLGQPNDLLVPGIALPEGAVYLRAAVNVEELQFQYSLNGNAWKPAGPVLDMTKISDDYQGTFAFTGAMVGIGVQDVSGEGKHADFDFFSYRELD
jgi:xylan 1,4-beta-xylosidase